jgi:hypothetical protein
LTGKVFDMVSVEIKARTGSDGVLHLDVPTGLPETEIKGRLVIDPVPNNVNSGERLGTEWPVGYFEATAGRWQGELARGEQGQLEVRDWNE